ncbi:MAG: DUF4232 domain-containing protein [Chloroflexota bacterium]
MGRIVLLFLITSIAGCASTSVPAATSIPTLASRANGSAPTPPPTPSGTRPDGAIYLYYNLISQRRYQQAYRQLDTGGRPAFGNWLEGYGKTAEIAVSHLQEASYRFRDGSTFTCAGVSLISRQRNGNIQSFGGWYMLRKVGAGHWLIDLAGSDIGPGAKIHVPSSDACRSGVSHTSSACAPNALRLSATWQGASGPLVGEARLRNVGRKTCVLAGLPVVSLIDAHGRYLRVLDTAIGLPPERELRLAPGHRAGTHLEWSNWCQGKVATPITLQIELPSNQGGLTSQVGVRTPRCDSSSRPSTLQVGLLS